MVLEAPAPPTDAGRIPRRPLQWGPGAADALRLPFEGASGVATNFSQAGQDIFVLSMLGGKRGGRYLEIGAAFPLFTNNTWLLSSDFGWSGVSIDFDPGYIREWIHHRPSDHLQIDDAIAIPYADALPIWFPGADGSASGPMRIDYLQVDIDPSANTLRALLALPLDEVRFSVITFETDVYAGDSRPRDESRARLEGLGYVRVASDVSVIHEPLSPDPLPFEDWWVDPRAVDHGRIAALLAADPDQRGGLLAGELLLRDDL